VCRLQLLLALTSAVILGFESRGTRGRILLSQIRDFPFRRLLRLAGLRWKSWTPPPHGMMKVKVTLRLMVSQSVSKCWCRAPSGARDQIFVTLSKLRSGFCGAPSLTRGRVCLLYMLLALASVFFLESESLGTRDHISLSQT
jgi:hypothetical protein